MSLHQCSMIWYLHKKGPMGSAPYMVPRLEVVWGTSSFARERKDLMILLYYSCVSIIFTTLWTTTQVTAKPKSLCTR